MNLDEYLNATKFSADPFASTNAEGEELLQSYFVPPPYFADVLGQPASPESHIVFAPRGGGKTAQRRMIELKSQSESFLCVLHDTFDVSGKAAIRDVTVDFHLREVARKLLAAILIRLDEQPKNSKQLDKNTRRLLTLQASQLLGTLTLEEFHREIQSLKSLGERAGDWIKDHSGPIRPVLDAVFRKAGLEPPSLAGSPDATPPDQPAESWKYQVEILVKACIELGYKSVYVLVDKIDELAETSADPQLAFELVAPLITNLPVMEMGSIRFKVFLWDRARNHYIDAGGRPDRIRDFTLGWDAITLSDMMTRRLHAHSGGRVTSLNELAHASVGLDVQALCAELAHGSPRDMVRLASDMRAAFLNRDDPSAMLSREDVFDGITTFSRRIADERYRKYMPDLLKINSYRFTQGRLANDLLRIKKQSAQAKVAEWRKAGLVEKVTELQDARNRPQHLYGVIDARLAIAMREDIDAEMVIGQFLLGCPSCSRVNVSDENSIVCIGCQSEFTLAGTSTLLDRCSR